MGRGSRPGEHRGGRKKGVPNRATREIKAVIEATIPLVERIELLADLARGVTVQETKKNGKTTIYTKPPDREALEVLEAYATGRPKQYVDVTSDGNEIKQRTYVVPAFNSIVNLPQESGNGRKKSSNGH